VLKTFKRGGIHPPENKLSAGAETRELPLGTMVYIPVGQHLGAPAVPVVNKGDKVRTGQLIAKSAGFVSANIHSSVSGTVVKVEPIPDVSGYPKPGIIISVEGDEWIETIDRSSAINAEIVFTGQESIGKIMESGIVGMGGATFPTHVKLVPPKGMKAE